MNIRCAVQWSILTTFFYEWLLVWNEEWEEVWRARWSLPKGLYIVARLGCLLAFIVPDALSPLLTTRPEICTVLGPIQVLLTTLVVGAADGMLLWRVHALHHDSRIVQRGLVASFTLTWAFELLLFVLVVREGKVLIVQPECRPFWPNLSTADPLGLVVIPTLLLNITLFLVQLIGVRNAWKRENKHGTRLVTAILRHGTLYFVVILVLMILLMDPYRWDDTFPFLPLIPLSCCHLYLDLRRLSRDDEMPAPEQRENRNQAVPSWPGRSTNMSDSWFVELGPTGRGVGA